MMLELMAQARHIDMELQARTLAQRAEWAQLSLIDDMERRLVAARAQLRLMPVASAQ